MENPTSSTVQSLNASGSSRIHVGNSYSITHHHGNPEQDGVKKYLDALRSTDPRDDKARIEQTNGGLLKDSYIWILESPAFITWRDESETCRLLWIRGDPGKGKTMLLSGLINELQPCTRLGSPLNRNTMSYFFCQATNSGLNNYTATLKGLIYLLVIQHPALVAHLDDKHGHDKDHWNSKVSLEGIIRKMLDDPGLGEIYLLVDALDECVEDLPLLLALISSTSSRAKWIVTSRNRCEIDELFGQTSSKVVLSLELHEESVSEAINSYISHRTRQLAERKKLKQNTTQQLHDHLSQNAHGTFLWVALVCQRLERCRAWEIPNQLLQLPQGLNKLYAQMMDQIRRSESCDLYMRVLAVASTVFRPLTFAELIAMEDLNIDEETIPDLIVECGSFLTTKGNTVVFVHKSAKDFLLKDSSALLFQSGLAQHQYLLFERCITIMQDLHKDMYGLVYPGVSLDEALNNCPSPDPLDNMRYSCVFWADHMRKAYELSAQDDENGDSPGIEAVHNFFTQKFLFWLEALALHQSLLAALRALLFLRNLPVKQKGTRDFKTLIMDALRFLLYFYSVVEGYPLQIYASGLLFSPNNSVIRRCFKQYTTKIISKIPKVDDDWSPVRSIFEYRRPQDYFTMQMSFAPSSSLLVVTTRLTLVRWRVNREPMPEVTDTYLFYKRLAPSPDGKWLASVSSDLPCKGVQRLVPCSLQVHDWERNKIIWSKDLGNRQVLGMGISPDNQHLLVRYDKELELYDLKRGVFRLCPLEPDNQEARFSFSSDSVWVAFYVPGCTIRSIRILNLGMGQMYKELRQANIGAIGNAKFIPNTHSLMICTRMNTVYLWNISERKLEKWGQFDYDVCGLALSHSDSWLVVRGYDRIYIYDQVDGTLLQEIAVPPLGQIAVSFDDQTIAYGATDKIYLFDVRTLLASKRPSVDPDRAGHTRYYNSHHGRRMAYEVGGTVEVWDANEHGSLCSLTIGDMNHHNIWAMAFSPDDDYLAVGGESSISVWTLNNQGLRRLLTRLTPQGPLAISERILNSRQWVAALRPREGICVWDIATNELTRIINPLNDSLMDNCSIAFIGSRMGVVFHPWANEVDDSALFLLYNVESGEQLSRISLFGTCMPISCSFDQFAEMRTRFSPSGELIIFKHSEGDRTYLWDTRADGKCLPIRNRFSLFSFLNESIVCTDGGIFHINSINPTLRKSMKLGTQTGDGLETGMLKIEGLSFTHLTCSQYSKDKDGEWIKFDNKPLIWLPTQYRGKVLAIGYDFIAIEHFSHFYSIRFASEADTLMRQALQNLI